MGYTRGLPFLPHQEIIDRVELVLYVVTNPKESALATSQQEKSLANAAVRGAYPRDRRRSPIQRP
jgi:hypothetical protein